MELTLDLFIRLIAYLLIILVSHAELIRGGVDAYLEVSLCNSVFQRCVHVIPFAV